MYRYLVRYWKSRKTPNTLLIDQRKSGKKAGINGCQKKQGRPARHEGGFGKGLNSDDIKNFSKAVKKYYLTQKKATLVSAYEKMLADDYTIMNGTGQLALLPMDKASVTERGIYFKGMYYSCEEALKGLWFEKAKSKGTYRMKIYYDPRNMGAILVENPTGTEVVRCELVEWETKYAGKQLDKVWYEQEKEKLRNKELKAKELEAKINLEKPIESIVDSAGQKSGADNAASKAEQVRNIRANRKNEWEEIRKKEAFTGQKARQDEKTAQSAEELEVSPIMRLI